MENNCFILKLKNSVLGDYDKLNFLKIKVHDGEDVGFTFDKRVDLIVKAEGCTFTLPYYQITDTEYVFKNIDKNIFLRFISNGDGYLYIGNKYNINYYKLHNVDLDKIYSLNKTIRVFIVDYDINHISYVKGNINHLLSLCSSDLNLLVLFSKKAVKFDLTGDIAEVAKFINLEILSLGNSVFSGNIIMFSPLINLTALNLINSNFTGNIEELALAWYNNGKTTGTVSLRMYGLDITVPSTITDKDLFYCTFTEEGYTFSQTNPNA